MTTRLPKNRIAGLTFTRLANGVVKGHWKPSPRLRRAGWTNLDLGIDPDTAILAAIARNREVEDWIIEQGQGPSAPPPRPRKWNFDELVHDYLGGAGFAALAPKTRTEYARTLKWLNKWTNDGRLFVADISADICHDLRDTLVAHAPAPTAAMRLRVLRIIMAHAVRPLRILPANPAERLNIPTPIARHKRVLVETAHALADHALAHGAPHISIVILLGFYSVQREGDLLALTRQNLRRMDDMSAEDRATLAGDDGYVWGLRLRQLKTKKWVDVQLPPDVTALLHRQWRTAIDAGDDAVRAITLPLIALTKSPTAAIPDWRIQRDFKTARDSCIADARKAGNAFLVDQLVGLQFRDFRRSGMCWLRDAGATIPMIASQSGHSITYTQRILDTYLPGDGRSSAAGVAMALRHTRKGAWAIVTRPTWFATSTMTSLLLTL